MKFLLKKVGRDANGAEFRLALLEWRNTPRADGFSLAYGFFGRRLRTQLPDASLATMPVPVGTAFDAARVKTAKLQAEQAGGQDLAPLKVGNQVHYKRKPDEPWCIGGEVVEAMASGRSYWIETPGGGGYRRNRVLLRLACPLAVPEVPEVVEHPPAGAVPVPVPSMLRRSRLVQVLAKRARKVRFDF
jgi:hypothetical protein